MGKNAPRMTELQVQLLLKDGKIRGYVDNGKAGTVKKSRKKLPAAPSKEKDWLAWNLWAWAAEQCTELRTEFKFCANRKWRFDWAFPQLMIAVEYEGLFSEKSGHTTPTGFTKDTEKYNKAQSLGWVVFRVTAINHKTIIKQLDEYLKSKEA